MKKGYINIETSFNIQSRGIVVVGEVMEGYALVGMYIDIDLGWGVERIRINGTKRGKRNEEGAIRHAFLLAIDEPDKFRQVADKGVAPQQAFFYAVG